MVDSGKCEHSVTLGWSETSGESVFTCEKGLLSFSNAVYARSDTTKESSVQLKLSFVRCNKLTVLKLVTNARFVEVSVMKDSLLKYLTTVRGTVEADSNFQSEFPLFEGQFEDETCEFRELHLKFLSIKPAPGQDATQPVQLVLKSVICEYTDGTPDTAPPLQQGPGMGGMGGIGGMGGGGGVEMMAMMAMSMMGGGMGGGLGGGMNGGRGGMPMPATGSGKVPGAPRGRPQEAHFTDAEKPTNSDNNANTTYSVSAKEVITSDVATRSMADEPASSNTTANNTADTRATQRAEPKTNQTSARAPASAPVSAPSRPAPVAPAGLDGAQLASIMWTVKSSMIDEISQLLDRKLAPVMARLDGIDAKLRSIETEVRARQEVEAVFASAPSATVPTETETAECDT